MHMHMLRTEECGQGQVGPPKEPVQPDAQIQRRDLRRDACQQPPGAAGPGKGQPEDLGELGIDRLDPLPPACLLPAPHPAGRAGRALRREHAGPVVLLPMGRPPGSPEAAIRHIGAGRGGADPLPRPSGPRGPDIAPAPAG